MSGEQLAGYAVYTARGTYLTHPTIGYIKNWNGVWACVYLGNRRRIFCLSFIFLFFSHLIGYLYSWPRNFPRLQVCRRECRLAVRSVLVLLPFRIPNSHMQSLILVVNLVRVTKAPFDNLFTLSTRIRLWLVRARLWSARNDSADQSYPGPKFLTFAGRYAQKCSPALWLQ